VSTNPVAKHLNKFNKPKRIEDKRYKEELKRMTKELKTESEKLQDNLEPIISNKEEELDPENPRVRRKFERKIINKRRKK
jgi:hypothetical protein